MYRVSHTVELLVSFKLDFDYISPLIAKPADAGLFLVIRTLCYGAINGLQIRPR